MTPPLSFDNNEWKQDFEQAKDARDHEWIHSLRKRIFMDTIKIVNDGKYVSEHEHSVQIPDSVMLTESSVFYTAPALCPPLEAAFDTKIQVLSRDSLIAGKELVQKGLHPVVLNMANRQNPGGGVLKGCGAQEENIFRRTNLFRSLYQYKGYAAMYGLQQNESQYPMDRSTGGIYSPEAAVFRGTEDDGYPLLDIPYQISIVSVAAINRPALKSPDCIADYLVEPAKEKMRTIFRIAHHHQHDSVVLGAMGCGAFHNPPSHIAKLFHEVMEEREFKGRFREIVFAILDDHNSFRQHNAEGNLLPFLREFRVNP